MATPTIQQVVAELDIALADHDPYVFGGTSLKTGADCSGVIYAALVALGVKNPPRTSQAQFAAWAPAKGPGFGIAVFFNVPQDGPPQPQHVGVCLSGTTFFEEPHTGLDAEVVRIPNIPGVESIMGYRYLPVSYVVAPVPPAPQPTPAAPAQHLTLVLFPTFEEAPLTEDQFFAWVRTLWYLLRKDLPAVGEAQLLYTLFNTPSNQDVLGTPGFAGSYDLVVANIHDTAGSNLK